MARTEHSSRSARALPDRDPTRPDSGRGFTTQRDWRPLNARQSDHYLGAILLDDISCGLHQSTVRLRSWISRRCIASHPLVAGPRIGLPELDQSVASSLHRWRRFLFMPSCLVPDTRPLCRLEAYTAGAIFSPAEVLGTGHSLTAALRVLMPLCACIPRMFL